MSKSSPQIAALGYYGFGNLGDEAVLAGIRRALTEAIPEHEMLILSADAAETTRLHPGVRTVDRWNWRAVASALRGTDLFILGGGSLLQDATSVKSVVWYTLTALLARRRSRRIVWWGQGIGPLRSPLARRLVRLIASQADAITVRDSDSDTLLKQIGVRGSIYQVADPAFALSPSPIPINSRFATVSPVLEPDVLFALRAWKDDEVGRELVNINLISALGHLQRNADGCSLSALPMHLPSDLEYLRSVLPRMHGVEVNAFNWRDEGWTPEQAMQFVGGAKLVVAMRLHALIFAARCGVPFVALSYDPKVDALAAASGQQDALVPVVGVTAAKISECLTRVLGTAAARRETLQRFAEAQGERARVPAGICRRLLDL